VVEQGETGDAGLRRRWALVLPHRGYLVGIAVRRGMSWHDAEDCAQEAMARCAGFEGLDETRVVEFLVSTTTRLCVDRHRLRTRDERVSVKLVPWYGDEPSPEENACDRDEAAWVAAHVAALPASQRAALAAKAEGLSCAEIATRMGLSYKAVESLLSRARTYVRASLASAYALVFGFLARRRAPAVDTAGAMSAFVITAAAVFMAAPALVPVPVPTVRTEAPEPQRGVAAGSFLPLAGRAVTSRPSNVRSVVARRAAPAPDQALPSEPPRLPGGSQIAPPKPCDTHLPHVDTCVPIDGYRPGDGLRECLRNGPDLSHGGVGCGTSTDLIQSTDREQEPGEETG
jgi:RNA polymerase sigma factor (sigma-70 family)